MVVVGGGYACRAAAENFSTAENLENRPLPVEREPIVVVFVVVFIVFIVVVGGNGCMVVVGEDCACRATTENISIGKGSSAAVITGEGLTPGEGRIHPSGNAHSRGRRRRIEELIILALPDHNLLSVPRGLSSSSQPLVVSVVSASGGIRIGRPVCSAKVTPAQRVITSSPLRNFRREQSHTIPSEIELLSLLTGVVRVLPFFHGATILASPGESGVILSQSVSPVRAVSPSISAIIIPYCAVLRIVSYWSGRRG